MIHAHVANEQDHKGVNFMRTLKIALAVAFMAASSLTATSIGSMGAVEAAGHVTKGKPGKCGVNKFYSKKDKGCISKA